MNDVVVKEAIIPELPKVLSKQQYLYYAPIASTESYGVVKMGSVASDDYYLKTENGIINVDIDKFIKVISPYEESAKRSAEIAEESAEEAKANTIRSITVDNDGHLYFEFKDGTITKTDSLKGPKPIKGVDYFTEQDIIDVAAYVSRRTDDTYRIGQGRYAAEIGNSYAFGDYSFTSGDGASAYTQGSMAVGKNAHAGSRAYHILAIDRNPTPNADSVYVGKIAIGFEPILDENDEKIRFINEDVEKYRIEGFDSGYNINDEFCIINDTHYAFCGRFTAVSDNILTYETVLTGSDYDANAVDVVVPFDTFAIQTSANKRDNWRDCVLWVPSKPWCGTSVSNKEGTDFLFNTGFSFGDNTFATADDAFVVGDTVFIGGNHGVGFGVYNKCAYGNLVGMRENISVGVHSSLLGRGLINLGSYNALFNERNTGLGRDLILGGCDNVDSGSRNVGTGNKNKNSGSGNVYGGTSNVIDTSYAMVNGSNSIERGSNSLLNGYCCVTSTATDPGVSARANTDLKYVTYPSKLPAPGTAVDCTLNIGNSNLVRHKQCGAIGRHLISGRNFQLVGGVSNAIDNGAMLVLGNGAESGTTVKNCFTVGANGTRTSVATDAVTVAYLETRLIEGTW